jgi:LacI family transcriptional regulator
MGKKIHKKSSISDVAKAARVSKTTVSGVLNQKAGIDPETIARVKAAIADLDYQPRRNRLRSGHQADEQQHLTTGGVSFVFPGEDQHRTLQTPLSLQLVGGAERYLFKNDINLITSFWQEEVGDLAEKVPVGVQNRQVDGLIFRAGWRIDDVLGKVRGLPMVQVFRGISTPSVDEVDADHEQVGRLAFKTLVVQGHRRVALLGSIKKSQAKRWQHDAFQNMAEEAGVEVVPYLHEHDDELCVERYLADEDRPEAVFLTVADKPLLQCLTDMRRQGLRPGHDLEMVAISHDPSPFTFLDGSISLIDIQAGDIGYSAAQQLIERIKDPGMSRRRILIDPTLHDQKLDD